MEVAGVCANGKLALEKIRLSQIDLMILDLEMPEMNGLDVLGKLAEMKWTGKTLVFTSGSKQGADASLQALRLGASDFILKPGGPLSSSSIESESADPKEKIRCALEPRILALFPESKSASIEGRSTPVSNKSPRQQNFSIPRIVLIGSSTGGPTVLEKIFSSITGKLACPVVIVQHMPPMFTAQLADRIRRISNMPAFEIQNEMVIASGSVYVVPGNYHARIVSENGKAKFLLDQGPHINSVRPAVDPTFESAANVFGAQTLAFVLTGMGSDGKAGAKFIKDHGGTVVIQDRESCVVFGMPGAVFESGHFDAIATPDEIIDLMCETTFCSRLRTTA